VFENCFKLKVLMLLILILLISCNKKSEINKNYTIQLQVGNNNYEIPLSTIPIKQKKTTRIWKKVKTELAFTLGGLKDTLLYSPTIVKTDNKGNIYILDPPAFSVKKFNKKGIYLESFGKKGRGPGEFISPFRFDVTLDGKVAVLDVSQNKCTFFINGRYFSINIKYNPFEICFLSTSEFAILQVINALDHSPIMKYDYLKKDITEYANILLTKKLKDLNLGALPFLQGEILNNNGDLIYIPKYLNFFSIYSKDGKTIKAYKTIDQTDLPYVKKKSFRVTRFKLPGKFISSLSASVVKNFLIIISNKGMKINKVCVADFYSNNTGEYKFSIKIPFIKKFGKIYFSEDRIFFNQPDGSIVVLNYEIES